MLLFVGLGNPRAALCRQPAQHRLHGGGRDRRASTASRPGAAASRARRRRPHRRRAGDPAQARDLHERVRPRRSARPMRFFKIPLGDVVVFHDELDLAPAKLRVKHGGGNAGHNGLRSITRALRQRLRARAHRHRPSRRQGRWCTPTCCTTSPRPSATGSTTSAAPAPTTCRCSSRATTRFQTKVHLAMEGRGWGDVKGVKERD